MTSLVKQPMRKNRKSQNTNGQKKTKTLSYKRKKDLVKYLAWDRGCRQGRVLQQANRSGEHGAVQELF